jgi:hypothetical protein
MEGVSSPEAVIWLGLLIVSIVVLFFGGMKARARLRHANWQRGADEAVIEGPASKRLRRLGQEGGQHAKQHCAFRYCAGKPYFTHGNFIIEL